MDLTGMVVGIDADDTLWKNEEHFRTTEARFLELVSPVCDQTPDEISEQLLATEHRNVNVYGFGAKGFTLSMVETAHDLSDGAISASALREIVALGQDILHAPVELLDGVVEALDDLRAAFPLLLITKGDLVHQQNKIDSSGIADLFEATHVVAHKDAASYGAVLARHNVAPTSFVMAGNSVRSDVLPVIELGGRAVHVPYHMTWAAEVVASPTEEFPVIDTLGELRGLLESWDT